MKIKATDNAKFVFPRSCYYIYESNRCKQEAKSQLVPGIPTAVYPYKAVSVPGMMLGRRGGDGYRGHG